MSPGFLNAKVVRCLNLDVLAAGVDVFDGTEEVQPMIAVCVGTACAVFDVSMRRIAQLGRLTGNTMHRRPLRNCRFSEAGHLVATCGDDNRAIVWSLRTKSAQRIFTGHRDSIYAALFAMQDRVLLTSSADGTVLLWNIRNGTRAKFFVRQDSAINTLHMCTSTKHVVSGSIDGHISVWDPQGQRILGSFNVREGGRIGDDITRPHEEVLSSEVIHVQCVRLSPSGQYLLTACSDNICRLWNVISFSRTPQHQLEPEDLFGVLGAKSLTTENQLIDLSHHRGQYDEQIPSNMAYTDDGELYQPEEAPLYNAQHADLIAELRHSGRVLACCFSYDSQLAITSSQDCTCRIWDVDTYQLMFQIATPVPMTSLAITQSAHSPTDTLVACCDRKLLVIDLFRSSEATEFADQWMQAHADRVKAHAQSTATELMDALNVHVDFGARQLQQPQQFEEEEEEGGGAGATGDYRGGYQASPGRARRGRQRQAVGGGGGKVWRTSSNQSSASDAAHPIIARERARLEDEGLTIQALRRLLAHGVFKAQHLAALLLRAAQVNRTKLAQNLRRFPLQAVQLLQAIVKCNFNPSHVLQAMSRDGSDRLFEDIMNDRDISSYMLRHGYEPLAPELRDSLRIMSMSRHVIDRFIHDAVDVDPVKGAQDKYGSSIRSRHAETSSSLQHQSAVTRGRHLISGLPRAMGSGHGGGLGDGLIASGVRHGSTPRGSRGRRSHAGQLRPMLIAPSQSSDQLNQSVYDYDVGIGMARPDVTAHGVTQRQQPSNNQNLKKQPRVLYVRPRPHGESQANKLVIQGMSIDFQTRHGSGPAPRDQHVIRQGRRAGQVVQSPRTTHQARGRGGQESVGVISQPLLYSAVGYHRILAGGTLSQVRGVG